MLWLERNKKFHQSLKKSEAASYNRNLLIGFAIVIGYFHFHKYFFYSERASKKFEAIVNSSTYLTQIVSPRIVENSDLIIGAIFVFTCLILAVLEHLRCLKLRNEERHVK